MVKPDVPEEIVFGALNRRIAVAVVLFPTHRAEVTDVKVTPVAPIAEGSLVNGRELL